MNYRLEYAAGGVMKEKVYPIDREVGCSFQLSPSFVSTGLVRPSVLAAGAAVKLLVSSKSRMMFSFF
jgi:hypothetical protein